jgi:hypothetical protein
MQNEEVGHETEVRVFPLSMVEGEDQACPG